MDRFEVAKALREIGVLLEASGGNPFKARAYDRGARALEALNADLGTLVDEDRLTEIPGIGAALAAAIRELHHTGRSEQLERLRQKLPPGVLELRELPGLTVARMAALHQALGITGLAELKAAAEAGRVRGVKGFGPKTEEKLLLAIRQLETRGDEVLLHTATQEGERLLAHVCASPAVARADLAGPARRACETVDRLAVAIETTDPEAVIEHVVRYPPVVTAVAATLAGCAARIAAGLRIEAETAPADGYAALLHELTGSATHRARLAERAQALGLQLDRGGLRQAGDGHPRLPVESE